MNKLEDIPKDFGYSKWSCSKQAAIINIEFLKNISGTDQVIRIIVDLKEQQEYKIAQNILIYPQNTFETVNRVFKVIGNQFRNYIVYTNKHSTQWSGNPEISFPQMITIEDLIKNHLDVKGELK